MQQDFDLLKDLKLDKEEYEKDIYKYIDKLQILFLKDILPKKIEKTNTKEELINLMYQMRYYNLIPYNKKMEIRNVNKFKELIDIAFSLLISKMYKLKMINTISTNEKADVLIVKNIFDLRMITLEETYVELLKKENNFYQLNIYDEKDTLEESIELQLEFNKKDRMKLKRKVKLF